MESLRLCIEKNWPKKFVELLDKKLKEPSFDINQSFHKEDPKFPGAWLFNLFSYACMHGRLEICKHLFGKMNAEKSFSLAVSVLHSQFHAADWLQSVFDIDCGANDSWPLTLSAGKGSLDGVKYALDHGADIHAQSDYALRYAAAGGHLETIACLVSRGADIHAVDDFALRTAILNDQFETAEWLLDHGADPNAKTWGKSVLLQLVDKKQYRLAGKAVDYGADTKGLPLSALQEIQRHSFSKRAVRRKCL